MRWSRTLALALAVAPAARGAHVTLNSGRRIEAARIVADEDGTVAIATPDGRKMAFRKGQYREAVADRPAELDRAREAVRAGRVEEAMRLLEAVERRYRGLRWDETAAARLGDLLFEAGRFEEAIERYRKVRVPAPETARRFRTALERAGRVEELTALLRRDVAGGSRAEAARAYAWLARLNERAGRAEAARIDRLKLELFFSEFAKEERSKEEKE